MAHSSPLSSGDPADAPVAKGRAFWLVGGVVVVAGLVGLDHVFYEHVSQRLNTEQNPFDRDFYALTKPFWIACRYGFGHVLGGMAMYFVLLAVPSKGWRVANAALIAVLAAALVANVAQGAIGRLRPNRSEGHLRFAKPFSRFFEKGKVSLPSGEAATAFALAGVLTRLFPRGMRAFYTAGTLAAAARLVNGAHYLSDVAAGAMLGTLVGGAIFSLATGIEDRWRPRGAVPGQPSSGTT